MKNGLNIYVKFLGGFMSIAAKVERLTKEVQCAGQVINELVRENYELRNLLNEKTTNQSNSTDDRPRAYSRELSPKRYSLG